MYGFPDEVEVKGWGKEFFGHKTPIIADNKNIFMEWSANDVLGLVAACGAFVVLLLRTGQTMNEVKNLGVRVDKLEVRFDKLEGKVDEILFMLSKRFKRRKKW